MIFRLILGAVLSYLLGSLNFGIILSRKFQKEDVRTHGSGNAGSTNMLRNYGKLPAVATILGDMAKVAVAILLVRLLVGMIYMRSSRFLSSPLPGCSACWVISFLAFSGLRAARVWPPAAVWYL